MADFSIISLGCPKNLVDSEYIVARLKTNGFEFVNEGRYIIVNTCAFIEDAVRESLDTIIELGERKAKTNQRLIVIGCLVERYRNDVLELLPEVDVFIGRSHYRFIEKLIDKTGIFVSDEPFFETYPRQVLTKPPLAYLKIQEGCDNFCSYCTIPKIRGSLQCRSPKDILNEFLWLLDAGFKEINIIGQDITKYGKGVDLDLTGLLSEMLKISGNYYIRLLYMHPKGITDDLVDLIAGEERIIKYLDIPIQHSEDRILALMNRGYNKRYLIELIEKIRGKIPSVTLRTSVIVGFPSETEDEFEALLRFIEDWSFDMLGAFMYSREEKTQAAKMKGQLTKKVKIERFNRLMEKQKAISRNRLKRLLNKRTKVIVEEEGHPYMLGRILNQAPSVDGIAFIKGDAKKGEILDCVVTKTLDYDVVVQVI
ncbi:MAG: 30S ribosomal protein S12 methylthiotransferase RimO [Desulfobacterota bacterium]|nr:30S ribosomal protein S12 methylthiotransferase RimO [Thermodesulfobacteriota bacterium]MDW8001607.1 30S ribosomal protein S12 methylthiotransferase RimO [Deltaproteobacteria bacterium]